VEAYNLPPPPFGVHFRQEEDVRHGDGASDMTEEEAAQAAPSQTDGRIST